jgi:hypothetical protein
VRSYFVGDRWFHHYLWGEDAATCWTQHTVQLGAGTIGYNYIFQRVPQLRKFIKWERLPSFHESRPPSAPAFHFRDKDVLHWGFNFDHFVSASSEGYLVIVPFWSLVLLFSILPVTWWFRRRRLSGRLRAGLCLHCGYDLRATPERCPECGTTSQKSEVRSQKSAG